MIYVLNSLLTIGKVQVSAVHAVEIKESLKNLANTATIVLPRNLREISRDEARIDSYIHEGDRVEVQLGYNDKLYTEFVGYVKKIGSREPLRIECEDEMYQARRVSLANTLYTNISLKDFLVAVAKGYKVSCSLDMQLDEMKVENATLYDVLSQLKEEPFGLYSTFKGKQLRVGLAYEIRNDGKQHEYDLSEVVDNRLEYMKADARNVRIKAISHFEGGKKETVSVGSKDGTLRTLHYFELDEARLRQRAEQALKRMQFAGYEGSVVGFGYPRTSVGDVLSIVDKRYPDRNARYLIDEVTIRFGTDGYRRENTVQYKL